MIETRIMIRSVCMPDSSSVSCAPSVSQSLASHRGGVVGLSLNSGRGNESSGLVDGLPALNTPTVLAGAAAPITELRRRGSRTRRNNLD